LIWIPRQYFATNPEIVQLWAEVLCRHQLVEETRTEPLSEADWESRRQKLIEMMPESPSTILTAVAHDRRHWIRRELIESVANNLPAERLILLLDRVIAADPHWWDYSQRAMSHIKLEHYTEAAADLATAARLEGDWFWAFAPEVLPTETMDRLLVSVDPTSFLRDEMKLDDQAVDVVTRQLAILRRSTKRTRSAARSVIVSRDQSPDTYRIASEYLQRKPGEPKPTIDEMLDLGLARLRLGQPEAALEILNKIDLKVDPHRWGEYAGFRTTNTDWYYPALALIHDRLGHPREAKEWLAKAITAQSWNAPRSPMLPEALEVILDRGFPADPFER
jgi:tetratricopeptide (TPR) repeat protein